MPNFRSVQVRDCQGTLWAFYHRYEGQATASFEGDLSGLKLHEVNGASTTETDFLCRQTLAPELDFVTVPINHESIRQLKMRLSSNGVLGSSGSINHTQLEVGGKLLFVACDNFHDECTVVSPEVPEAFLKELQDRGLLCAYGDA
jgi:hypothetical protein